ncbi:MAG TPA: serine hydrolase [Anaerolineales bacterium]|nr:serine hydrolase [Anaerolineales bacterium]
MNLELVADAEKAAADLPNIRSFLVMWNGSIVSENYYGGMNAATPQHIRSITKSIVSALIGIAIDKGILHSVNDKVLDYVPELKSQDNDERKQHVTVRHLLTMTSGFMWEETGEWFFSDTLSAISDAWRRPLARNPGEIYNYDSASSDLLTVVLARAANQEAKTFMIENLFAPLEITDFEWEKDPAGYHRGSAGLIMRAPDLTKIGQLYLQKGQWKGRQIVSQEWIEQSTAEQVRVNALVSYGYLWRSRQVGAIRHHYGMGYGGQYLMVVPGLNIVVVASHEWQVPYQMADQQKYDFTDRVFDPMLKTWQTL